MRPTVRTLLTAAFQAPAMVLSAGCAGLMLPGYWPEFDDDFTAIGVLVGILAAGASAWRATATDATFLTASTSPARAAIHHFATPVAIAWAMLAANTAILSTGPLGENPGGAPTWGLLPATICWVTLAAVLGTAIGTALRRRGLLAALVAVLIALACLAVSRLHATVATLAPVLFTWAGEDSTVNMRPEPRLLWTCIGCAVVTCVVLIAVTVSRVRWRGAAAVVIATVAGVSLIAAVTAPAGAALRPRGTDVDVVCTPVSRGARICGWPEEAIGIRALSPHWDEVTAAAETLGAPIPHGTTYSDGLAGLPGDHRTFTLTNMIGPGEATIDIITKTIRARGGPEPLDGTMRLFYPENVGIAVQEALFPDPHDRSWLFGYGTEETEMVRNWVGRVGTDAIGELRGPTDRYLHGAEPNPPWDETR